MTPLDCEVRTCVAVCRNVLHCVAVCCSGARSSMDMQPVTLVDYAVRTCVAVCC